MSILKEKKWMLGYQWGDYDNTLGKRWEKKSRGRKREEERAEDRIIKT